jgi:hypothetical protein
MIIPVDRIEFLFEINMDYKITSFDNGVLIIDDFYKNYEDLYNYLQHQSVPKWKALDDPLQSKNFFDYYDCRLNLGYSNNHIIEEIKDLIIEFYGKLYRPISRGYEFNYFKIINKSLTNNYQHFPHRDFQINSLIYLDKECNGGTALYPDIKKLDNNEAKNLLMDVSIYSKHIIESKPNRLVLFNGNIYHGGYIENYSKYETKWRINQVMLFSE